MARSKGVTISVKVPINRDVMTRRTKQRLRQIVGRDARVIRAYLGVIEQHEDQLLTGRKRLKIDDGKVDQLTITALKVYSGKTKRVSVPHDFKTRFPRMSTNEMVECRQTAVALYESYLNLRSIRGRKASKPTASNSTRRIPRWVFYRRFFLVEKKTTVARWWIDLRDSLDSSRNGKHVHDRLMIPLKMSPYHLTQLSRGDVKALQVFTDSSGKWWVTIAVRVATSELSESSLSYAVLGIDLGIAQAACTTLVTPEKVRETRYFRQQDKNQAIKRLDKQFSELKREFAIRKSNGIRYDRVLDKLRRLGHKRENIAKEHDRILVCQLMDYIAELSTKYTLYISIGKLRGIRQGARRGNFKGNGFRRLIHKWAFARVTNSLRHGLAQRGWKVKGRNARFRVVSEFWTSKTCWKCGRRGSRPKQNLFVCPTCGNKCNADKNGSTNIAGRLITLTDSLHSVRGLGFWTRAVDRARSRGPKARGKSSRGKSLLSKGDAVAATSSPGETAAVRLIQTDLLRTGGVCPELGDNDPAVAKTVERLSVAGSDVPASVQEKDTRSAGGIPSP
ncbi:MAG: zinc ribbon domain-containing protein [Candidatus Thorarchaeota archaeon]